MTRTLGLFMVASTLALGACDDGGEEGGGDPDGGGVETQGATVSYECVDDGAACDPPGTYEGTATATELDLCNYWESTQAFQVGFIGPDDSHLLIQIANFTGAGSYTTSADAETNVVLHGTGEVPSDADAAGPPEHPCTITVESNLADLEIPETGDAELLDVTLEVECPTLIAGGICDVICTLSPSTFSVSVGGCTVSL